jgi:hypothetical protein
LPHDPEVLKKLAGRCAAELHVLRAGWSREKATFSAWVHELTREEVRGALLLGIFEVDRSATAQVSAYYSGADLWG